MNFFQKVYYNDKPLVLTTNKEEYIRSNPTSTNFAFFSGISRASFIQAVQLLEKTGTSGVIIEDIFEQALLEQLFTTFRIVDAGGGVTYNEEGAILMIFRRGKWDLPKGKLDNGEEIEECALREVSEETGLEGIILGEKIGDTYHIYEQKNEQLLKRTAWYKMKGSSAQKLKPQKEENILEARWVKEEELAPLAAKSYEAIKEVLKTAGLNW